MKKAEWQAVYAPQGDALERRVRHDARRAGRKDQRTRIPRRARFRRGGAGFGAHCGGCRGGRADSLGPIRRQAAGVSGAGGKIRLYDGYGELFHSARWKRRNGQTVVTYRANKDVGDFAWKLGDYTVTIRNGQAEASWSNDGEAVGDDFSSDVWNTALLARGIARRKAGEEWYEITGTVLKTGTDLSDAEEETALVPEGLSGARLADEERGGCGARLENAVLGEIRPDERKPCAV